MVKKDFTKAAGSAADKFFTASEAMGEVKTANNTNDDNNSNTTNDTKYTHVTNKSKHYDKRGKREERHGLLMDKRLKEDLKKLANATGSRSINDFIVTVLLEYVESPENQEILNAYSKVPKPR